MGKLRGVNAVVAFILLGALVIGITAVSQLPAAVIKSHELPYQPADPMPVAILAAFLLVVLVAIWAILNLLLARATRR
jgi:hypothetical protein